MRIDHFSSSCQICGGSSFVRNGIETVCTNCGCVISTDRIDPGPEWRSFGDELEKLQNMYIIHSGYELIGVAYIIPYEGDESRLEAKMAVERAGVEAVIEYEKMRARSDEERRMIKDVSYEFRGYDVVSFDRVIEVKSFKTTGKIELTSNEWIVATRLRDYYWLYIVENALSNDPKIFPIQNPVEKFNEIVKKVPIIDYKIYNRELEGKIK